MMRTRTGADESHVFDQTNGVVDLGSTVRSNADGDQRAAERHDPRTVRGMAMLSVQKP